MESYVTVVNCRASRNTQDKTLKKENSLILACILQFQQAHAIGCKSVRVRVHKVFLLSENEIDYSKLIGFILGYVTDDLEFHS